MLGDFQKAKEEFDKLSATIDDPAIPRMKRINARARAEDKVKYLRSQDDIIKQYRQQATTTLEEQKRRMRDNIVTEIRAIVTVKRRRPPTPW